jgi:hypothetical protein
MPNRFVYFIGGLFFTFLFFIGIKNHKDSLRTQKYGQLINVTVTEISNCFGTKQTKHYFKFEYIDKGVIMQSAMQIGSAFCKDLYVGKKLNLRSDLKSKYFLLENENIYINFYSFIILGIAGLILFIIGIFKSN